MTYIYTLTDTPRGDVVAQIGHECHGPMTEEIASERAIFADQIKSATNGAAPSRPPGTYPTVALLMCHTPPTVVMAVGRRYPSLLAAARILDGVVIE